MSAKGPKAAPAVAAPSPAPVAGPADHVSEHAPQGNAAAAQDMGSTDAGGSFSDWTSGWLWAATDFIGDGNSASSDSQPEPTVDRNYYGGTEKRDELGNVMPVTSGTRVQGSQSVGLTGSTRSSSTATAKRGPGGAVHTDTQSESSAFDWWNGSWSSSASGGSSTSTIDAKGSAEAVKKALKESIDGTADPARKAALQADLDALTPENAADVAARHSLAVDAATKENGSSTASSESFNWSFLDGSLGWGASQTDSKTVDGTTTSKEASTDTTVKMGGGVTWQREQEQSQTVGDKTSGTSEKMRGGLVVKDGQVGHTAGVDASQTWDNGVTATSSADVTVTNSSAGVKSTAGVAKKGEQFKGGTKVSANGTFKVDVVPVKGTDTFQLVVSVAYGGSLGGDLGANSKKKATTKYSMSGSLQGDASAELTFKHTMSAEEAAAYMSDIDSASDALIPGAPEFELIHNAVTAASEHGGSADEAALSVLGDADSAAALGDGSSVQMVLKGSVSGGLNGDMSQSGGPGVSGGVKGSHSETRTLSVEPITERDGHRVVKVTLAFADKSSLSGQGSVSMGVVTGSGGMSTGSGSGYSASFKLDPAAPEYKELYAAITHAVTESELRALQGEDRFRGAVAKTVDSSSRESGQTAGMAVGPKVAAFELAFSTDFSDMLTESKTGAGYEARGGQSEGGSMSVLGTTVASSSTTASARAGVSEEGSFDLEFSMDRSSTAAQGASSHDTEASIDSTLEKGPRDTLQKMLTDTWKRLSGYSLSDSDVDALISRANNERNWADCADYMLYTYPIWMDLRETLLDPNIPERFADVDPTMARKFAQAKAIAEYLEATGDKGYTTVRKALREWGRTRYSDDGEDIGLMWEWPDAVAKHKGAFDAMRQQNQKLASLVGGHQPGSAKADELAARLADDERKVWGLHEDVDACNDFVSGRAKMEILDRLGDWAHDLIDARQVLGTDPDGAYAMDAAASDQAPPERRALREVSRLEDLIRKFPSEESALFDRAYSYMPEMQSGLDWWAAQFRSGMNPINEPADSITELEDLHEFWIDRVKALRSAYTAAGIDVGWMVSAGRDSARTEYEPSAEEYAELAVSEQFDQGDLARDKRRKVGKLTTY